MGYRWNLIIDIEKKISLNKIWQEIAKEQKKLCHIFKLKNIKTTQ